MFIFGAKIQNTLILKINVEKRDFLSDYQRLWGFSQGWEDAVAFLLCISMFQRLLKGGQRESLLLLGTLTRL